MGVGGVMSLMACLKKSLLFLFVAGLALVSLNISDAQVLPAIPGTGNLQLGSVKVVPFVQVGYKSIGLSYSLPFAPIAYYGSVDLSFQDAGVWVGSVGFDAHLLSTLFVSLRADANARKNISVVEGEDYKWNGPTPYNWSGSQLQWWDIDGMVGYTFYRDWSVVAGVRYEKLTVGLRNAVDATGTPVNYNTYQ